VVARAREGVAKPISFSDEFAVFVSGRMEDPSFGETEEYWTSLPSHLRNFIRNALPITPSGTSFPLPSNPNANPNSPLRNNGTTSDPNRIDRPAQNTMLAMAQQIVSAAHAGARGGTLTANAVLPPGSFDPSSLDFAFQPHPDHGMERQHHHHQQQTRSQGHPGGGGQGGGQQQPNGAYLAGAAVGGVVMLDDPNLEEYDRCAY
jgi:hypothetical protein